MKLNKGQKFIVGHSLVKAVIFSILILTIPGSLLSQGSYAVYSPEICYRNGLEMVEKANYGEARNAFQRFVDMTHEDPRTPLARYYIAYSALNLYNLDAEQLFVDFIRQYPSHPKAVTANYDLGNFYFKDKNYKDAVVYLSKVNFQQLSPEKQSEARFNLAYAYFSLKKFPDALNNFNILKRGNNRYTYPSAYYTAYIAYNNKEYEMALNDLKIAEKSDANKLMVPYFVVNIYYRQKRYDELINYGEDVLKNRDNLTNARDIYLLVGEGYYYLEEYVKADEYYQEYSKRFQGSPPTDVVFRMAVTDFNLKDDDNAIKNLKLIASRKDEYGVASSFYLGWLYLRKDNLEFAAAAFKIAADQTVDLEIAEKASFEYAKASVDLGRSDEAIRRLQKFLTDYPESEFTNNINELLSLAYLNSNNLDLAIEHMESLPSLSMQSRQAYQKATLLKGNLLFNQRKYREAIVNYSKSLKYPLDDSFVIQAKYWKAESYSIGRKYEEAIPDYMAVVGVGDNEIKQKARYGLGYCYFNTRDYAKALPYFSAFMSNYSDNKRDNIYQDARLRLADCHYTAKAYNTALELYSEAVSRGSREKDYAYLQIGTMLGIRGEIFDAKDNLNRVIHEYTESPFVDDALFELASIDFERGNYQASITGFSDLIAKKPTSPFVPYSLQRRAIAHFNMQNYRRTEEDYKNFLNHYPSHKEANNVLLGLQEVMAVENKTNEFENYLSEYKLANPETEGLEVVEYESAKSLYNNQEYDKAIASFTGFSQAYPDDYRVYEAKYYIAESYYRKNDNDNALPLYYEILTENQASQIARVIQRIADIEFANRNYSKSIGYYHRLESNAYTKRQLFNAWTGLMRSFFELSAYDSTASYVEKIIEEGVPNAGTKNVVLLYQGKVAYARGNYEGANTFFEDAVNNAKDVSGAEAQFLIGEILHQQKMYTESNEVLFSMPANFSIYEHWLGSAFLLIADNYISMEEYLQARATLNSIIENTESGVIANLAKAKLDRLDELEAAMIKEEIDTLSADTIQIENLENENNEN